MSSTGFFPFRLLSTTILVHIRPPIGDSFHTNDNNISNRQPRSSSTSESKRAKFLKDWHYRHVLSPAHDVASSSGLLYHHAECMRHFYIHQHQGYLTWLESNVHFRLPILRGHCSQRQLRPHPLRIPIYQQPLTFYKPAFFSNKICLFRIQSEDPTVPTQIPIEGFSRRYLR
jgi:hypothetical protein